jgi:hypothetical protein
MSRVFLGGALISFADQWSESPEGTRRVAGGASGASDHRIGIVKNNDPGRGRGASGTPAGVLKICELGTGGIALRAQPPATLRNASGVRLRMNFLELIDQLS